MMLELVAAFYAGGVVATFSCVAMSGVTEWWGAVVAAFGWPVWAVGALLERIGVLS